MYKRHKNEIQYNFQLLTVIILRLYAIIVSVSNLNKLEMRIITPLLVILVTIFTKQTKSSCCWNRINVFHSCRINIPFTMRVFPGKYCHSRLCLDGALMTHSDMYCGVGSCNIFDCNCDGGCRSGTPEETVQKFVLKYDLTSTDYEAKTVIESL